ncbi:MAG: uracil-DNA glycosylase [Thermoplasmata archaeon]|nr:MAG: uracil-DNA glycosylase [Thermoplasmata archaeon]RLF64616.1 MAG: uracil-DNA glycosylase [Thermoplasmata archaeon]
MVCKWYELCPIKKFTDEGLLESRWVEEYCKKKDGYKRCERYRLEEKGVYHSDYMLPDGKIDENLKISAGRGI